MVVQLPVTDESAVKELDTAHCPVAGPEAEHEVKAHMQPTMIVPLLEQVAPLLLAVMVQL